jgi:membrane-bound lytic murein transglycosylase D
MHKKIFLTLIFLSSSFSISCSNKFANYAYDFWTEVRSNFALTNEHNEQIQHQLNIYLANKRQIEKSFTEAAPYMFFIKEAIKQNKLPMEMLLLPMIESEYKPFAHSWAGASGIWQMMPGTASGLNLKINWWIDERRSIVKSTNAAMQYLTYLNNFFENNWLLAIASYDSGAGTVQKAIKKANSTNFWQLQLPRETQNYIPKLLALRQIIKSPSKYGIKLPNINNQPYFRTIKISKQLSLQEVAAMINITTKKIYHLNPEYRRWSTPPKGHYFINIPIEKVKEFNQKIASYKVAKHQNLKKYKIKHGESINSIAKKTNIKVSHLIEINQLNSTLIKKGHSILIPTRQTKIKGLNLAKSIKVRGENLPGPRRLTYIAKKTDSIYGIAKKFHVNPKELIYWNQLKNKIHPGETIVIWKNPYKIPKTYIVKKHDSLIKIAKKYNISIKSIQRKNNIRNNIIKLNQELQLR